MGLTLPGWWAIVGCWEKPNKMITEDCGVAALVLEIKVAWRCRTSIRVGLLERFGAFILPGLLEKLQNIHPFRGYLKTAENSSIWKSLKVAKYPSIQGCLKATEHLFIWSCLKAVETSIHLGLLEGCRTSIHLGLGGKLWNIHPVELLEIDGFGTKSPFLLKLLLLFSDLTHRLLSTFDVYSQPLSSFFLSNPFGSQVCRKGIDRVDVCLYGTMVNKIIFLFCEHSYL